MNLPWTPHDFRGGAGGASKAHRSDGRVWHSSAASSCNCGRKSSSNPHMPCATWELPVLATSTRNSNPTSPPTPHSPNSRDSCPVMSALRLVGLEEGSLHLRKPGTLLGGSQDVAPKDRYTVLHLYNYITLRLSCFSLN